MQTSFSTAGSPSSSNVGIFELIVRSTMPMWPCWTSALTRKRPIPPGEIANWHSLVASNSAACRSFMTDRTSSAVCCGDSGCCDTGVTLPSSLMAGGKPAVMKRSDAFLLTIRRKRS
jgi:hypothetical protein